MIFWCYIKACYALRGFKEMASSPNANWRQALESLPATPDNIPAFFFAHGSPMLANKTMKDEPMFRHSKILYDFLEDFGPALLKKYNPKGIVVFSAHWETAGERHGTICYANQL